MDLGKGDRIAVKTFKDWVSVNAKGTSDDFWKDSVGLLGNYSTGARLLARDGVTILKNDNEFGQEWQVLDRHVRRI